MLQVLEELFTFLQQWDISMTFQSAWTFQKWFLALDGAPKSQAIVDSALRIEI